VLDQLKLALTNKSSIKKPIQLILFITDRCNARCGHCFNWRALNQGDDGLELDELDELSKDLGHLMTFGVSGGEPFLRSDLAQVYGLFSEKNQLNDITIPTNALTPVRTARMVREMVRQAHGNRISIQLSLDGLGELHDRIRGVPGNFNKLQDTYRELLKVKAEFPDNPPLIKVGTVICNWNVETIPELIDWVRKEMPEIDFHNFEIMRGTGLVDQLGSPTIEQLERTKPYIFDAWDKYSFYGGKYPIDSWIAVGLKRFIFTMYIEMLRQEKQLIPCYAGETSAVVDAKGNVYFCEMRETIGNLREQPLHEMWNSDLANSIRESIHRGDCYCVHSCFPQKNGYANPRIWPHIVFFLLTGKFTLPTPDHIKPVKKRVIPAGAELPMITLLRPSEIPAAEPVATSSTGSSAS
jgi:MoaA/NifB/PqqE/SkfB family radical SAM enzyme